MSRPFTFKELQKYFNARGHQEVQDATFSLNKILCSTDRVLVTKNIKERNIEFFSVYFFSPSKDNHIYAVSFLYLSDDAKTWIYDLSKYHLDSYDELFTLRAKEQTAEETELIQRIRTFLRMYLEEHPTYRLLFVTGEQTIE